MDEDELARLSAPLSPNAANIVESGMSTEAANIHARLRELPQGCGIDHVCCEHAERLLGEMDKIYEEKAVRRGGGHVCALATLIAWIR